MTFIRCFTAFLTLYANVGANVHTKTPGGGALKLDLYGGCGHRIGKLTHPQTKAGTKTDPFSDYSQ